MTDPPIAASVFRLHTPIFALPLLISCITRNGATPPETATTDGIMIELVSIRLLVTVYEAHVPTATVELDKSIVNCDAPAFEEVAVPLFDNLTYPNVEVAEIVVAVANVPIVPVIVLAVFSDVTAVPPY